MDQRIYTVLSITLELWSQDKTLRRTIKLDNILIFLDKKKCKVHLKQQSKLVTKSDTSTFRFRYSFFFKYSFETRESRLVSQWEGTDIAAGKQGNTASDVCSRSSDTQVEISGWYESYPAETASPQIPWETNAKLFGMT